ncbi:MAG: NAD(P)H-hydrate epimerase, partial [Actinomycetota bacterium]
MIPIVTPAEMAAIDAAAPEPVEELIERAGAAVARAAVDLLGGTYGRRVVIVAGPGNNGADGRSAATRLRRRGVRCTVVAPDVERLPAGVDLVIDAAYGTGLSRPYAFPAVPSGAAVLAVDISSGVHGLTGARLGAPVAADRTITFAALKPGLVLEPGRSLAGDVVVADIGLDTGDADVDLVEGADVADWLPVRA